MCNILLVDMNSFYASVHQVLEPSLRGKPVIVCGDPKKRHGIVLAASYEAKKFGVKTTMPKWEAERLAPHAVFLKPEHHKYAEFSSRIMNILSQFSPLVEPASIDEAFIDVSGCKIFGDSIEIAKKIKMRIKEEVGVLCSVGIGPNKLIAKMAADIRKPDGLTLVTETDFPYVFWPLPVRKLFGVGAKTALKLRRLGIVTIGDLAHYPANILEQRFGRYGRALHLSANGINYSPVNPESYEEIKSIGNQITLSHDCTDKEAKPVLIDLSEKIGFRVRQGNYMFKTVTLTLRDTAFVDRTWSHTLPEYTDTTEEIIKTVLRLMADNWAQGQKIRLIGASVSNMTKRKYEQTELFCTKEKFQKLNRACDDIKNRFGFKSIIRGTSLMKHN